MTNSIQSEYIENECFQMTNFIQSGRIQIECFWVRCLYSMAVNARAGSESDDESSEDGCVEEPLDGVDDDVEQMSTGGDEAAVDDATTNKHLP